MTRLVLRIDRLQLRGIPPEQRDAVVAGLHDELARAFAQPGMAERWAAGGHRDRVRLVMPQAAEPRTVGRDAGRHIANEAKP